MCAMRKISELSSSGMKACSEQKWANADFLLTQALNQAKAMKSDVLEAKISNNLGIVHLLSGRKEQAKDHFSYALQKLTARIGEKGKLYQSLHKSLKELE